MGVADRLIRCLSSHPHPLKLKEIPKVLLQFTGLPVHLPPFWPSHGPRGLYNDCIGSEADGPDEGNQASPVPGRLVIRAQSQTETQMNTQTVVDLTQSLGWIINQGKSELKPTQVFSFMGYEYKCRFSSCKTHSREMAQTSGFDPTLKVKTCFDFKMLDISNWVTHLNRENGAGGTPSHEALSVSPQGALEISPVIGLTPSLVRNHLSSPTVVVKFHICDEGCRPSFQRPQYPTLYKHLN